MCAPVSREADLAAGDSRGGTDVFALLAAHPAVAWVVALAFAVTGLAAVHADIFLNNEGILSWMFSGLTSEAPVDLLFLLKARPPISAFYAPVAVVGLSPFLWMHVLVASLAIPITASLARNFGNHNPNLPAVLVAVSPLYFAGAAAGIQNTDATVGVLVVAWLLARNRPVAAGLLLSLVVIARVETLVFAVAFATYALLHRDSRRLLGAAVVIPLLFWLAGALYHGDFFWPLHYPSSVSANPIIGPEERAAYGGSVANVITTLLALTPVIGVLLWMSLRGGLLENIVVLAAVGFVIALRVLPFTQLVYVDASPRYVLPALPFVALAIGRAVAGWGRISDATARGAVLIVIGTVALVWVGGTAGTLLFAAALGCVAAATVAVVSRRAAAVLTIAVAAAGAWPLFSTTHLHIGDHEQQLDEVVAWMRADLPRGAVVVTDQHILDLWLTTHAPGVDADVRHLVQPDIAYEMGTLTNPATRQFARFFETKRYFYAPWIFPEDITSLPGEVAFVMRTDTPHRVDNLSRPPFDRVDWVVSGDRWVGGRLRPAPAAR